MLQLSDFYSGNGGMIPYPDKSPDIEKIIHATIFEFWNSRYWGTTVQWYLIERMSGVRSDRLLDGHFVY